MENYFGSCKACQKRISVDAKSCPQCGKPDPLNRFEHHRLCKITDNYVTIAMVFGGILGIGVIGVFLMLFGVFTVSSFGWGLMGLCLIVAIIFLIMASKSYKQADEYFDMNVRMYLDQ